MRNFIKNTKKVFLIAGLATACFVGASIYVLANNGTLLGNIFAQTEKLDGNGNQVKTATSDDYLSEGEVKTILLDKVPGATITKIYLEVDDGRAEYDGEMYLDDLKYEFTIEAVTGAILEWNTDRKMAIADDATSSATTSPSSTGGESVTDNSQTTPTETTGDKSPTKTTGGTTNSYIGEARAKEIAMAKANITSATVTEIYLEYDDGRVIYDGNMYYENIEYEFEIDAVTGVVLEWDVDSDDDKSDDSDSDDNDDNDND